MLSVQRNSPAEGPTLRRDTIFVGTSRQAAVMRVQTRHVAGPVAARRRTLALLLLPPGRVWRGQRDRDTEVELSPKVNRTLRGELGSVRPLQTTPGELTDQNNQST